MLDIDDELREVQNIETQLKRLDGCKKRIGNEGMSREIGIELQDLCGGPIDGIDVRRLTANPSSTGSIVANEAIDIKRIALMMVGSVAVLTLLIKLLQWLFGSSGGGGGGGGGSAPLREMEDEVKKLVEEAKDRKDQLENNPDSTHTRRFGNSLADHFIEEILLKRGNLSVEDRGLLMSRVKAWFQAFKIMDPDLSINHPAFIIIAYLAAYPNRCLDFRMLAFADESMVCCKEAATKIDAITTAYRTGKKLHGVPILKRYISQELLDEANDIMELIRDSVDIMAEVTDIYESTVKYPNSKKLDDELAYYKNLVVDRLFGEKSTFARRTHDSDYHIITVDPSSNVTNYNNATTNIPTGPTLKSVFVDTWTIQMSELAKAKLQMVVDTNARAAVDSFGTNLAIFGNMYQWFFTDENIITSILENANMRQLKSFKDKLHSLSKKTEKEAKDLQERIKRLQSKGAHIDFMTNRNLVDTIDIFLKSTIAATKSLATYCKHIEIADDAIKAFKK